MREFLRQCRVYFVYAGFFSLFANLLMLSLPIYMLQLFDRVMTSRSEETLVMLSIAALGAFAFHGVLDILRSRLLLGAGIALDGLAGPPVLAGALANAARPGSNEFAAGLGDVGTVRSFLTGSGITSLFDAPWMPIYLFVIYVFHPLMGFLATLGAIALFGIAVINERITRGPLDEVSDRSRRAGKYIDAGMRNAEVVSGLGMLENLRRRWQKLNSEVIDSQVLASRRLGLLNGLTRMTRLSLQILMLGVGASLVIQQHVSPGIMIAGTLLLSRALSPVEGSIQTWKGLIAAREAYARLTELLTDNPPEEARTPLPAPAGRLDLERVTFIIPGMDRQVIKGISLTIEPGQAVGLIGPSAAGKSTLARLILGIWRPTSGTVRLDGADISAWPRKFLGPHIGYLPQDVELFSGTVAENIARLSDAPPEQIIEAAQRARAHDMILRLPNAYDTEIGFSGARLSAGQRQRIALARAVFGNPRLVVLDEPNSNLDTEGEDALIQTMRTLTAEGVTVITISHRPSLLASVDKLIVLRDGAVEMYGPRAEVLARVTQRGTAAKPETPQVIAGGRPI